MKTIPDKVKPLPEYCLGCDVEGTTHWQVVEREVEQVFRGESVFIQAPVTECRQCGFRMFHNGQADHIVLKASAAYRTRHGLLTPEDIRARRAARGMSQAQFAEFLGVGIASVKRWELGFVQDRAHEELMRAKTSAPAAVGEEFEAVRVTPAHVRLRVKCRAVVRGLSKVEADYAATGARWRNAGTKLVVKNGQPSHEASGDPVTLAA